ncbi:hypothetical protein ACL03H_21395 [Saccharopolyspora sp. MS10]|uniref:hypothetical protein n=1 Tax=Saccharopolyspora sp. MS10 TaxID=3385973 RepID=UPI0039A2D68A
MATTPPLPDDLDQLNFDQLAQLINERQPELYYQRADEFDRAAAQLQLLIDGLRATMRKLEAGMAGLSMDKAAQAAEHLAAKNEQVLQAMQQPGYAAMLRRAGDSLTAAQQRLRDLQQQRAEQSDIPVEEVGAADQDRTEQARQIIRDLGTAYGDVAGGLTPLPGTGPGSTPVDQISDEGASGEGGGANGENGFSNALYYGPDGTPQVMDANGQLVPAEGTGAGPVGVMYRSSVPGGTYADSTSGGGSSQGYGGGDGAGERAGNAAPWLAASARGAPSVLGQSGVVGGGGGSGGSEKSVGGWRMASASRSGSVQDAAPQVLGRRMSVASATGGQEPVGKRSKTSQSERPQTSSREPASAGREEISTMSAPEEGRKEATGDAPGFLQSHFPGHVAAAATGGAAAGATAAGTLPSHSAHAPVHAHAQIPATDPGGTPPGGNPPGGNQPGQPAHVAKSAAGGPPLDAGSSGGHGTTSGHSTTSGGPRSAPTSALEVGQVRAPGNTPTLPRPGGEFSAAMPGSGGGFGGGGSGHGGGPMHGPMGMMGGAGAGAANDRQQERQPNVPVPADRDSWDDGNGVLGAVGRRSRPEEDDGAPKEKTGGEAHAQIDEIINDLREERKIR